MEKKQVERIISRTESKLRASRTAIELSQHMNQLSRKLIRLRESEPSKGSSQEFNSN
ncbi:MAG: hypothetical protein HRU19_29235 [Pseudobacteriovorax sp.]|nr:hypothetical protein [Pseudobacteriovorax sp.]